LVSKNAAITKTTMAKIATKTERLARIIDNLLKLVTNNKFMAPMVKTSVDVREMLQRVTSDHRPFATERKQELLLDVSPDLPRIEADQDKLEDALTNLVSNAIKFSPDGGTIRVAAQLGVSGDTLEILVEDSGAGIPQHDISNVFEPFFTGKDMMHHHSGTFEFGAKGIGLGLAIVRRFVELHGGMVRVRSLAREPGVGGVAGGGGGLSGTQFLIQLPLNRAPDVASPSLPKAPTPQPPPEHPDTPEHASGS